MHSFSSNCSKTPTTRFLARPEGLRPLLIGLLLLTTAGCARFQVMTSDDVRADIQTALDADDYRHAQWLTTGVSPSHPDYEAIGALQKQIATRLEKYQKRKIAEAADLANGRRWQQAHDLLDDVAARSPRGDSLISEARSDLDTRERIYYERIEGQVLLGKAQWLAGAEPRQPRLQELTVKDAARMSRDLDRSKAATAERLTTLGRAAGEREEWITARDLLRAAQQLAPTAEPDPVLEAAQAWLNSNASKKRKRTEAAQKTQADKLIAAYRRSGKLADLLAARSYIEQHTRGNHLEQARQEVASLCLETFDQGMRDGEQLYAGGDYQGALTEWRAIQPIFPNHSELEKKMARVYRVLESLESLNAGQ